MVIDASALVALLLGDARAEALARAIAFDPHRLVGGYTVVETGTLLEARKAQAAGRELDLLLHRIRAEIVPLGGSQAEVAREAWRRYGRRRGSARLGLGACCTYALARETGEHILTLSEALALTDAQLVSL